MKKILIIQNQILHYRKALYNLLCKHYSVTILHSGKPTVTSEDKYQEIVCKSYKFGPFFAQPALVAESLSSRWDVIIAMADLHWTTNILSMYLHHPKADFIWWGSWLTQNVVADKTKVFLANRKYQSILYSQEAKDAFVKHGVNPSKLYIANNTFDVGKRFRAYENEKKTRILFVGSLDTRKQLPVVLRAFGNMLSQIPDNISLTIIGDGPEQPQLKALADNLDLSQRVFFEGRMTSPEQLYKYYNEAIVSVSYGQAGLSVLQSFGFGVPFLTRKNAISGGEISNITSNYNGILCNDSPEDFELKLMEICNDIPWARQMGQNAYKYYSDFCTMEKMAQGFIDAIENIPNN